ncbi:MAG: hypothetical protein ACM3PD_00530 [Chloroflexota bacterium]
MSLEKSKLVPTAFWVGFLALGFVTSLGGPAKHRVEHAARTASNAEAVLAQSDKPVKLNVKAAAQD